VRSNHEQVANLLYVQVNSASYYMWDGKWVVAYGWLIGAVVCPRAALRIQLFTGAHDAWPCTMHCSATVSLARANQLPLPRLWSASGHEICEQHYIKCPLYQVPKLLPSFHFSSTIN